MRIDSRGCAMKLRGARLSRPLARGSPSRTPLATARERKSLGLPALETAIEDGGRVVTEVSQHPPEPRRHLSLRGVVCDHLDSVIDAEAREALGHGLDARHRMPAVFSVFGSREVPVEVGVDRPRQMLLLVLGLSLPGLHQVEAAVDERP